MTDRRHDRADGRRAGGLCGRPVAALLPRPRLAGPALVLARRACSRRVRGARRAHRRGRRRQPRHPRVARAVRVRGRPPLRVAPLLRHPPRRAPEPRPAGARRRPARADPARARPGDLLRRGRAHPHVRAVRDLLQGRGPHRVRRARLRARDRVRRLRDRALRARLAPRVPQAALHFFALAFLLAMATNDALAAWGVLNSPYLVDLGFIVPIGAVGYSLTARFAADARALAELRLRLESLVDDRTRDLARAQEALHRAEKLAALGQFAAGVAHEVNNPAAVVVANLKYLAECRTDDGAWPADTGDCVSESLTAMDRIARIVRQLLDASRLAAAPVAVEAVSLARVAQESLRTARARCGQRVPLEANVPEDVLALGQESMLVQIAVNLVVNAVQAIPADRGDGHVRVSASRGGGRVRLAVEDNGSGMSEEVLRRVFEPFFSTKPFGGGTGLGLAVSRGLVQSLGGD